MRELTGTDDLTSTKSKHFVSGSKHDFLFGMTEATSQPETIELVRTKINTLIT